MRTASMTKEAHGCSKQHIPLTLYRFLENGEPAVLEGQYKLLPCGHRPVSPEVHAFGILLCKSCAQANGFPAPEVPKVPARH